MAVLGDIFPVWLGFRGGKGVATALGVLASLMPLAALAGLLADALVFGIFRVSSIGSLSGGLLRRHRHLLHHFFGNPIAYAYLAIALLVLMLFTHRSNLKRLLQRQRNADFKNELLAQFHNEEVLDNPNKPGAIFLTEANLAPDPG